MSNSKRRNAVPGLSLWPHQEAALAMSRKYIADYIGGITKGSALVQMPTGSGKSGVIAVMARCLPEVGLALLLTPRISLRDQLCRDVDGRFFRHVGFPTGNVPKRVKKIRDGELPGQTDLASDCVLVTTIQKLVSMERSDLSTFARVAQAVSLVVVDEGHYEPAKEWSKVIRLLTAPKVIFTATPYRNDFKVFDIDTNHVFTYALSQAVSDEYLRSVEVIQRPTASNPQAFVEDVVQFCNTMSIANGEDTPRVIIRCDNCASIRHLATALLGLGKTVVGIHEQFRARGGSEWEHKYVPNPDDVNATYWIHQFKLLEGIDDRRFQVLALFQPIRNARSLVQQVGRILRNPERRPNARAFMLDHWRGMHEELWRGFVAYDRQVQQHGIDTIKLSTGEGIAKALIRVQPKTAYVNGRFRSEFDFRSIRPIEDIHLPLRTNILRKEESFSMDVLITEIVSLYEEQDRAYEIYTVRPDTRVILSVACANSLYLRNHSFLECDLHIAVMREYENYVAFFESSGLTPMNWEHVGVGRFVEVKKLRRLFSGGADARITSVSLKNSNIGTSAIRSKTVTAASMQSTVPGFDDYAQICTTAEGYSCILGSPYGSSTPTDSGRSNQSESIVRRYVGFSRGRVSDPGAGYQRLQDYLTWLDWIRDIVDSRTRPVQVLNRYAPETGIPSNPAPRSVLLDIEEVRHLYVSRKDGKPIEIEDACCPVDDGTFHIVVNGDKLQAEIVFVAGTKRYAIKCADLEERYITQSQGLPPSIVDYLNRQQSFRILPQSIGIVYVNGQFYRPAMRTGRQFDKNSYELGHCFVTDERFRITGSEKGTVTLPRGMGWDNECLFGIIDRLGSGTSFESYFGRPNIIVCDDMEREVADFIMCQTDPAKPKVIFIHAKACAQAHKCSASALHVVCSQAVKNLGYLAMFSLERPAKTTSWGKPWLNSKIGSVRRRIRRGDNDGPVVWQRIKAAINNPLVDKEVWLFLGQVLSRQVFENKLAQNEPASEALQAAYLLHV